LDRSLEIKDLTNPINGEHAINIMGCGTTGYRKTDISPLFRDVLELENIYLPRKFIDILEKS